MQASAASANIRKAQLQSTWTLLCNLYLLLPCTHLLHGLYGVSCVLFVYYFEQCTVDPRLQQYMHTQCLSKMQHHT